MSIVQRIDGSIIEGVQLTNISTPDEEGSRSATAILDGETRTVYNSIIDGFNRIWVEQMSMEEWRASVKLSKSISASVRLEKKEE